jgi:hypothetical protein
MNINYCEILRLILGRCRLNKNFARRAGEECSLTELYFFSEYVASAPNPAQGPFLGSHARFIF